MWKKGGMLFICQKSRGFMNERKKQIQLAVDKFTSLVRDVDGVIEVALFGSAASDKPNPQDFDLMVFIENVACIPHISKKYTENHKYIPCP